MLGKVKWKPISAILIILFLQVAAFAYAEGGKQAASPGGAGQKPFNLAAVTLVGGGSVKNAVDVPTDANFYLQFDKNVVNSLIWGVNSKCVSLVSQDDENIPVNVTKLDDTIDFSQRQNIFVQPVNPLRPGTAYYLKISPELKAKNGATLGGTGITIAFKTKGEAVVQPSQSASEPDDIQPAAATPATPANVVAPNDLSGKDKQLSAEKPEQQQATSTAAATGTSIQDLDNKPKETTANFVSWITPIGIVLVAGWIVFEILIKRNRKQ